MAIRRIKEYAWRNTIPERETLNLILKNVVGFDLNPLAVVSARTNYLLALGDLLQHRGSEEIDVPVYLCDSILTPSEGADLWEKGIYSFGTSVGLFSVPASLVEARKIDALANLLEESVRVDRSVEEFRAKSCQLFELTPAAHERDIRVLDEVYRRLRELQKEGVNGIWARVIKNAFAPLFVRRFEFVTGNPPWVNWEHLPENYRERLVPLYQDRYKLFLQSGIRARHGSTKIDISALMLYVSADRYLDSSGRLAFVITESLFKTQASNGFRQFRIPPNRAFRVMYVDDLSTLKPFEGAVNKTAVVILKNGGATRYPLGYGFWKKRRKRVRLPEAAPPERGHQRDLPGEGLAGKAYRRKRSPVSLDHWAPEGHSFNSLCAWEIALYRKTWCLHVVERYLSRSTVSLCGST
jgi:hypothetical protein